MENYWHLLSNHLPIIGSFFAFAILALGLISKSTSYIKLALWITFFCGISSFVAHITGEKAEHFTEKLIPGTHDAIENHENQAFYAYIASLISGIISLILLSIFNRLTLQIQRIAVIFILILLTGVNVAMFFAGKSGGQIRHEELRPVKTAVK